MQIFFSKMGGGFFIDSIHEDIPADKVVVSATAWQHMIAAQSPTSQLSSDPAGNPVLIDPTQENKVIYTSVGVQ